MLVVDDYTVKLLTKEAEPISLTKGDAKGESHSFRVPFNPGEAVEDAPASAEHTIDLGYKHGFTDGQPVVYNRSIGESIGGLSHEGEFYIIKVSEQKIRLATSAENATAGTYIQLDKTVAKGSFHSLGKNITARKALNIESNSLQFGGPHGFRRGAEVTYGNGGGSSIGGLTNDNKYFVLVVDPFTIKLCTNQNDLEGSVVDLDAASGTGRQHTLSNSSKKATSITAVGDTDVIARNDGSNVTVTVAGSGTSETQR